MDDQQIIDLFFDRSEIALEAVKAKYGSRAQQLAAKRDRGKELESCFVNLRDPQQLVEAQEISQIINLFLDGLDEIERRIFVRRYYYFDSCAENSYEIEALE